MIWARPIIIFLRDNERRALSTPWLLAAILPIMEWFPLWKRMSGWDKQVWEMQSQRESPNNAFEFQGSDSLKPRSPLDFSHKSIHFLLATLIWASVAYNWNHLQRGQQLCLFVNKCVCLWNRFAPEPHIRVVLKSICLNIRTCNGTRFRMRENSNQGEKKTFKAEFEIPREVSLA